MTHTVEWSDQILGLIRSRHVDPDDTNPQELGLKEFYLRDK